jgi:ATP-dependent Clp protease ATP-binding subunit ClpB
MTSNIGSELILDGNTDLVLPELKKYFRPEFINRVDDIVVFKPLSEESISKILDKIVSDIELRLKDNNIHIKLTEKAKKQIVEEGFDPNYGARPLKRLVSRIIETEISKLIISDKIKYGDTIVIDYNNNYEFKVEQK